MKHKPGDRSVVVRGHSMSFDEETGTWECEACHTRYYEASGATATDWCSR